MILADAVGFVFGFVRKEKLLFEQVLRRFPLIPAAHHRVTRSQNSPQSDAQPLLDEALAQQRKTNQKRVQEFLSDTIRFQENKRELHCVIRRDEIEWLLQVLNDVRVGAWLALGEPEESVLPQLDQENARDIFAMEMSGYFQSSLLMALERAPENPPT